MARPHEQRWRLWLLALLVGAMAALVSLLLHTGARALQWLATGSSAGLVQAALGLPPWQRLLVGSLGGLLAGAWLAWGLAWAARKPGAPPYLDYIEAARQGRVDLNDRSTLARTLSALFSVGSGASIGREGPMVQMSAWAASVLARALPLSAPERQTLLVCGIAAGVGAVYHAPVAGVVFVLELALGFGAPQALVPLLLASVSSNALVHWTIGPQPLYAVPDLPLHASSLALALPVGALCGALGGLLLWLLAHARALFAAIASLELRLGLGGALVGLLSMAVPEVWGNGYSVLSQVLHGPVLAPLLALLLLAKLLATVLSTGSGAIGGVFTPSLLLGAVGGSLLAALLPPAWVGAPTVLAVLGMAGVLAAVTQAPLMALVMVLEMTQAYGLTLPAMLCCAAAYAVSTLGGGRPLYGNPIEARH